MFSISTRRVDENASHLWRLDGPDSDARPVCVYESRTSTVHPSGCVEFLARVCQGSLLDGAAPVLGAGPHEFVHRREAKRAEGMGFIDG
ncbi:hypothetical protein ACWEQL_21390 [Kitasatospora sp. NPDC004240]